MRLFQSGGTLLGLLCLISQFAANSEAQSFPVKPVRYIVPSSGGAEVIARLIAQGMTQTFHQQVVVDVRGGAGANIGAEIAAKAPADGYTLFQVMQAHAVNVSLYRHLGYDLVRDFAPVTRTDSIPMLVVVHPSFPAKSLGDLVALAKAKPGAINHSSAGAGTSTFLAAELFKISAGINMLEVPYKGGAPALTAVLAGEVSVYFAPLETALQFVQDGKLRLLAITAAKRLPMLPEYPTVAESGYPGYESSNWHGLMVPAKTSQETTAKIRAAVIAALNQPEINKRIRDLGYTIVGDQPGELAEHIKLEIEKWRKIIHQKGLAAD